VLILPPGHAQEISSRRSLSAREKWMVGGVLAMVAAVILILLISIGSTGKTSAHGCIYATIPGAVGAQEVNECGADARATCQSVGTPGAFTAQAARAIAVQCRKAGLAVRP
jgi:hypothetical protein